MPLLSAAALAKKDQARRAALRIRLQFKGVYTPDIATHIGKRLELLGKDRDESGEPVGETTDHSKCLVPLKTLAGMFGLGGEHLCVYLARANSDEAKRLLMLMASKIFPMNYELNAPLSTLPDLEVDVGTKAEQAIFALLCGRSPRDYDGAMGKAATAKQLLDELISQLPENTQQPEETTEPEAAQPESEAAQPENEAAHDLMDVALGDIVPTKDMPNTDKVGTALPEVVTPQTARSGGADNEDAHEDESGESGDESGDQAEHALRVLEESEESGDDESEEPQVQPQAHVQPPVRTTTGGKRPRERPLTPSESESESGQSDQESEQEDPEDPEELAAEAARALADQQAGRAANKRPRGRTTTSNKKRKHKLHMIASTGRVYCGDGRAKALRKQKAKAREEFKFTYASRNSMFLVVGMVSRLPDDKTSLTKRPLVPVPFGFNYQLFITMLAGPENYALVVQKSVGNVTQTIYVPKEEIIAHLGPYRKIFSPHAGLVDAINNFGTKSLPKGQYYEYTPSRLEVDTAVHAFNDPKYRVPHAAEAVGTPAPVQTVATLEPLQVLGTVVSPAF